MNIYLVIPSGENPGSFNTERSRTASLTPEDAVRDMARRDFMEFSSREESYDVYLHRKVPVLVGEAMPAPPEEECSSPIILEVPKKACGCGDESCEHGATPVGVEAKLVALFIQEGVADPPDLALKVLKAMEGANG